MFKLSNLPPGTHVETLQATDVVTGEPLIKTVVWADRPYDHCPRCQEFVGQPTHCPAYLDAGAGQGGQILDVSQQHGCGEWLTVFYTVLGDATPEAVHQAAQELADDLEEAIEEARSKVREELAAELRDAMRALAEPVADGETPGDREDSILTGSETRPGTCIIDGELLAWAYDPAGEDEEGITVRASEVQA